MRGSDERTGELFSYIDIEERVPENHPLQLIRLIVNEVLAALDREFAKLYAEDGRPSIAPERLLRALLLQAFYTIRSERQWPLPDAFGASHCPLVQLIGLGSWNCITFDSLNELRRLANSRLDLPDRRGTVAVYMESKSSKGTSINGRDSATVKI